MISDSLQRKLRELGVLSESEVLKKEGDLYFALNVVSQERRLIQNPNVIREVLHSGSKHTGKKVLKG